MSDPATTFGELEGRVLTLFGTGDLDGAREAVRLAAERFPDRLGYTAYWSACIDSMAGQEDAALDALTTALERDADVWWGRELLHEDPDLAPLRARPAFDELVAECDARRRAEQAVARVEWEVISAKGARRSASMALVVLHGRTGNLRDLGDRWGGVAEHVDVVLVQSSQVVAHGMHCWDDLATAGRDVAAAVAAVDGDGAMVVLGGFSQGAGLATRVTLKGDVGARGFLAIAPSFFRAGLTPDDMVALAPGARRAGVRGVIFAGAKDDRYRDPAEEVARRLADAGVPIASSVVPGMGHDYPDPFARVVEDALSFIFGETEA
ncbi:MAG TPA: hypothetical protein VIG64_04450 [Actinomycetota bacterium]|jgi:hypothetical protein